LLSVHQVQQPLLPRLETKTTEVLRPFPTKEHCLATAQVRRHMAGVGDSFAARENGPRGGDHDFVDLLLAKPPNPELHLAAVPVEQAPENLLDLLANRGAQLLGRQKAHLDQNRAVTHSGRALQLLR
jgi:hypothetical protein